MGAALSIAWLFAKGLFGRVVAWFAANPAAGLTIVMAIAFFMVITEKNHEISRLNKSITAPVTGYEARLTSLRTSIARSEANNAVLNDGLIKQNASIENLALVGTTQSAKFDQLMAGMSTSNATTAKKLTALDAAKPTADKCSSALALVKGAVQ